MIGALILLLVMPSPRMIIFMDIGDRVNGESAKNYVRTWSACRTKSLKNEIKAEWNESVRFSDNI